MSIPRWLQQKNKNGRKIISVASEHSMMIIFFAEDTGVSYMSHTFDAA